MTERGKLIWVYLIMAVFIATNSYLFIVRDFYWGALTPVILLVILIYFISLDKIILLITFFTPIALNIRNLEMGFGISLPTEPMMLGVLVFFIIRLLLYGKYEFRVLRHPLTIVILLNLIWILFTSITSELPLVSFKFFLSRLWFVIPFYFFAVLLFKKYDNIKLFIWLYVISFTGVIFYTLIRHSAYGFDEDSGHWIMSPFYNDHTAYSAILTMYIPFLFGFSLNANSGKRTRIISVVLVAVFMVALVFSYGRAAWISLASGIIIYIIVLSKIKFRWVFLSAVILFGSFFTFQNQIVDALEKNKQDSSANFVEHIQSISNISSDASNLERINRWQSAIRMFGERPFWGWGPGTYQFLYGPFQMSKEKTVISTNEGDLGNAHSEYIGPLAESGFFGMFTILLIVCFAIYYGLKVYRKSINRETRILSLSAVIGLITYFIHGFLNNFLDSDKASVPVWGFMAVIVALEVYHCNSTEEKV